MEVKRWIAVIFACLMLMAAACSAADAPDPAKWYHVGANEEIEVWLERGSVHYSQSARGKIASVLVLFHKLDSDELKLLNSYEINMDTKEARLISYLAYDQQQHFVNTVTNPGAVFKKISPGSVGEDIYNALLELAKTADAVQQQEQG